MLDQDPNQWALFLDLDGTLIEIAPAPDAVTVPSGLATLVADLTAALKGALAIISGRPITDIDRFLAPLTPVAAGVHGAELRAVTNGEVRSLAEPLDEALIDAVSKLDNIDPEVVVEPKGRSIAVHYRNAPGAGPSIEAAMRRILEDTHDNLMIRPGRKVFEIVPSHVSKGRALERILDLPEFRGRRPVMIGDDITDESAFDAALRHDGLALRVAGEQYRRDEAHFANPAEVRAWLASLLKRLGRR